MIETIIQRIVDTVPEFEGRVTAVADFKDIEGLRDEEALPMCFVCFDVEDIDPDFGKEHLGILVSETRYAIIVVVNNRGDSDKRGHKASIEALSLRQKLINTLHDWKPRGAVKNTAYGGGEFIKINQSRGWWRFDFDFYSAVIRTEDPADQFDKNLQVSVEPDTGEDNRDKYTQVNC